jgi:hypothetical protein
MAIFSFNQQFETNIQKKKSQKFPIIGKNILFTWEIIAATIHNTCLAAMEV